ncbi:MAG TPA: hypothetical protein VM842_01060, partial [Nitrospira sp.]|nr:hypothetical protein [Nitrospira sp.]
HSQDSQSIEVGAQRSFGRSNQARDETHHSPVKDAAPRYYATPLKSKCPSVPICSAFADDAANAEIPHLLLGGVPFK